MCLIFLMNFNSSLLLLCGLCGMYKCSLHPLSIQTCFSDTLVILYLLFAQHWEPLVQIWTKAADIYNKIGKMKY